MKTKDQENPKCACCKIKMCVDFGEYFPIDEHKIVAKLICDSCAHVLYSFNFTAINTFLKKVHSSK